MAKIGEVLLMLCPDAEYSAPTQNYEDIDWLGKEAPITKAEFEAGFTQYDAWKAEKDAEKVAAKAAAQAKLAALGLTVEDLQALGL